MSGPDLERLKLAFAHHLVEQVVDADGRVDPEEAAFLEQHFPRPLLVESGLLDLGGDRTEAYEAVVEEALTVLPGALDASQKAELMGIIRDAAQRGSDERESNVVIVAARFLGLNPAEWAKE